MTRPKVARIKTTVNQIGTILNGSDSIRSGYGHWTMRLVPSVSYHEFLSLFIIGLTFEISNSDILNVLFKKNYLYFEISSFLS